MVPVVSGTPVVPVVVTLHADPLFAQVVPKPRNVSATPRQRLVAVVLSVHCTGPGPAGGLQQAPTHWPPSLAHVVVAPKNVPVIEVHDTTLISKQSPSEGLQQAPLQACLLHTVPSPRKTSSRRASHPPLGRSVVPFTHTPLLLQHPPSHWPATHVEPAPKKVPGSIFGAIPIPQTMLEMPGTQLPSG